MEVEANVRARERVLASVVQQTLPLEQTLGARRRLVRPQLRQLHDHGFLPQETGHEPVHETLLPRSRSVPPGRGEPLPLRTLSSSDTRGSPQPLLLLRGSDRDSPASSGHAVKGSSAVSRARAERRRGQGDGASAPGRIVRPLADRGGRARPCGVRYGLCCLKNGPF